MLYILLGIYTLLTYYYVLVFYYYIFGLNSSASAVTRTLYITELK